MLTPAIGCAASTTEPAPVTLTGALIASAPAETSPRLPLPVSVTGAATVIGPFVACT